MPAKSLAMKTVWRAEILTGKIVRVEPRERILVVHDSNGIPFDLQVTRQTRIVTGNRVLTFKDLEQDQQRSVSIKYVPERRGDVARVVRIGG
jgi:hypothetical protein